MKYIGSQKHLENLKKARLIANAALRTHGMTYTREYSTWCGIIQRCTNPNNDRWADWGGRGITVCDRWRNSFEAFYEDMGPKPKGSLIDRIDNNGNYEPGNCRWTNLRTQCINRRSNVNVTYCGITLCLTDWAKMCGFKGPTLNRRYNLGYRGHELFAPIHPRKKR